MVIFGTLLLIAGAICEWIVDNSVKIGDQMVDMDVVGIILLAAGAALVLLGVAWMAMATNTSHQERHDVIVDKMPDERPVVIKRRRPRKDN